MAEEVIYTVFVSSTYEDLQVERAEVLKSLLKLHCMPIGMELFGSAQDETWEFIKRQIDNSDYYVLIVADKYGSVAPDGVSYTEKEYDYARETGKPTLAFVHAEREKIQRQWTESDPAKREKLDAFIAKVKTSPVSFYKNPHELAGQVITSFVNCKDQYPAVGYVRANKQIDAKKYSDVLEENIKLKAQLSELTASENVPFLNHSAKLKWKIDVTSNVSSKNTLTLAEGLEYECTWGEIFYVVAEAIILKGGSENKIFSEILSHIEKNIQFPNFPDQQENARIDIKFSEPFYFSEIKSRLFGWGLITFQKSTETVFDRHYTITVWSLTEYAQKQYGLLMPPMIGAAASAGPSEPV